MTDRPHILALDHIASINDPIRVSDDNGNPHLHYSAQHVKAAFLAGAALAAAPTIPATGEAGPYRARESFGDWYVEKQFSCINGLGAWFSLAKVSPPDEAAIGYTDGAIADAEVFAKQIADALNSALVAAPARLDTEEDACGYCGRDTCRCDATDLCQAPGCDNETSKGICDSCDQWVTEQVANLDRPATGHAATEGEGA